MKKFFAVFLTLYCLSCCFVFSGCKKEEPLLPYVSELKQDIFTGESENYTIKAFYGFREQPQELDGTVKDKKYSLTFILLGKDDNIEYTLSYNYNGETYAGTFKYNPANSQRETNFIINGFTEKQFTVTVFAVDKKEEITLNSIVPINTASYVEILSTIREKQKSYIESLYDDGKFTAEIILRIIVKDEKPYYYVGIHKNKTLKAFLIDGISKEILAIREVF